jgi:hypothetical protein
VDRKLIKEKDLLWPYINFVLFLVMKCLKNAKIIVIKEKKIN